MRIVVLHNRYRTRGGEDSVVEHETALLRERGHDVLPFVVDNRDVTDWGVARAVQAVWSRASAHDVGRFLDASWPVDVVHVHNTFPLLSPSVYSSASVRGIAVVQTLHNFRLVCPAATLFRDGDICTDCVGRIVPWPGILHACYRDDRKASAAVAAMLTAHGILRTWSRRVDAFIALTEAARQQFAAGGLPPERLHVRPNFVPDPGAEPEGRRDRGRALFIGRLSEEKGVRVLLEAWAGMDTPLTLLGEGRLRPELEREAPRNVQFLGHVSAAEVRQHMLECAFLVVPSTWLEGCPMVVLEAYALGIPVLASDLGSLREIVRHGETGLLFRHGDAESLDRTARELSSDPELRKELGRGARAAYEVRYSPDCAYQALLDVYGRAREVACARGSPGADRRISG